MKFKINEVDKKYDQALTYLRTPINKEDRNNYVFINTDKVRSYYEKAEESLNTLTEELHSLFYAITGIESTFNPNSHGRMRLVLTEYLNIPEDDLMYQGKPSLRSEVLSKLLEKYNSPFLGIYAQYRKIANIKESLTFYYNHVKPIDGAYNNEGDRIGIVRPLYEMKDTYRFNSSNPNIQGLNNAVCDVVTAPEGWVILQVDSKQIELKLYYSLIIKDKMIDWLIEEYGDAYYAIADYCLRDSIEYTDTNLRKHGELPEGIRPMLKTLMNAGNYGSSLANLKTLSEKMFKTELRKTAQGFEKLKTATRIKQLERMLSTGHKTVDGKATPLTDMEKINYTKELAEIKEVAEDVLQSSHLLAERFYTRIVNHPKRKELEDEINRKVNRGYRDVESPFGDIRRVYGYREHIKRCFINNPIQMASSRLSAISICKGFELTHQFNSVLRFAFNRHDEDIYYCKKEYAEELLEIVKDFRQYEIEGWLPIYTDAKITLDYQK